MSSLIGQVWQCRDQRFSVLFSGHLVGGGQFLAGKIRGLATGQGWQRDDLRIEYCGWDAIARDWQYRVGPRLDPRSTGEPAHFTSSSDGVLWAVRFDPVRILYGP
jgi:hypothetical protein